MTKNCCVACYDRDISKSITERIKEINSYIKICYISDETSLISKVSSEKDLTIFFDKFFLGYILKYKLIQYKLLNPDLNIFFVEKGCCPIFFGLRLYSLGVNGFICNIENKDESFGPVSKALEKISYYPEEVLRAVENNELINERQSCNEITEREFEVGLLGGQGKSLKEICYELGNMAVGTVGSHMNRFHRKIGFKKSEDMLKLYKHCFEGSSYW